ncbi:MAG: ABC transporter ATP-binding protein [Pseudomonadota bacterium]
MVSPLLSIQDLKVAFRMGLKDGVPQVAEAVGRGAQGVSFDVAENQTVALVGESGSGKSVTAMSIVNLLPDNAVRSGRILWRGEEAKGRSRASSSPSGGGLPSGRPGGAIDLLQTSQPELRRLRGREIACVFQDPMSSLNPVFSVGQQLIEPLVTHLGLGPKAALARAEALLQEVGIPDPARRLKSYPHELSGGQQQRVMIAMALACEPKLLIADEPTTALDVTIQRQIVELLAKLQASHGLSVLFISHDLALVGEIADKVVVMRQGTIREQGSVEQIFSDPQDAYTKALLACRPTLGEDNPPRLMVIDDHIAGRGAQGQGKAKDPDAPVVLEVKSLAKSFWLRQGVFGRKEFHAVKDVNFKLRRGHTLGVVGESGSGKTTMGLTLLRLHDPHSGPMSGEVMFDGHNLLTIRDAERQQMRRRIQIVFQNPYASLNPRFTIGQALIEPMAIHGIGANTEEREQRARALLGKVGLDDRAFGKYPHEFSGGQRQRVAIARCLTLNPEVLVLDESVSALDVSVQAQVLNLLKDLQDELGLAYIFISHDLAVVRFISDEVLVMKDGAVVEQASAEQILKAPQQEYTRRLIGAVPKGWQPAVV